MISEIVDRLPNFKDIRAISAVCNPWREACLEMKTKRPTWPWLMFSDTIDIGPRRSLNMCDRRHYQFELPTIHERRCLGSPHVVAVSSDLGCMNAAKWPPHWRPTRRRTRDAAACATNCVHFFFFFFFWICADSRQTGTISTDSCRIRSYRPNIGVFRPKKGNQPAKKKKKLKTKNTSGFDTSLSPSSLALTPFFFFFFFFASSPSSSFFLASPVFLFLFFYYKFCLIFFFFLKRIVKCGSREGLYFVFCASHMSHISPSFLFFLFFFFFGTLSTEPLRLWYVSH